MKLLKLSLFALLVSAVPVSAQVVMDQAPLRGMLGAGQVVYVRCGPGKAQKITGGSNVRISGSETKTRAGGSGRIVGPCVPFKG